MSALENVAQLLLKHLGRESSGASIASLLPALQNLLPTENGELDLGSLIESFTSNGSLVSLASSWLGDGENSPISAEQIASVLGDDKISQFAGQLGIDASTVSDALSSIIPQIIDGNTEGGNLLDNPAASLAQSALKSLF